MPAERPTLRRAGRAERSRATADRQAADAAAPAATDAIAERLLSRDARDLVSASSALESAAERTDLGHARRDGAVGLTAGIVAIAIAAATVAFPDFMSPGVYAPTFSMLGLHLLWLGAALLALGQGAKMLRMARWARAHEDEDLIDTQTQLTLWAGALALPLLAVVSLAVAIAPLWV